VNNKEKEVKIKVDSFDCLNLIEAQLLSPRGLEKNYVFDKKGKLYSKNKLLRLRTYQGKTYLTFKGPKEIIDHVKVRDEHELELSSFDEMVKVLESLGYQQERYYEKYRQIYLYNNVKIMLDELPRIGNFIEVEGNLEDVKEVVEKLNLNIEDGISEGYSSLSDEELRF
jgi:predicted adenylyl cyclase CyaB